ncbi:hypothetical protein Acsp02_90420 [Actinoplanes sp. NBRC 103695]|nr:hypothetical protein Acsp02_90420 [Actinoplanes sp. NBRC 103695]
MLPRILLAGSRYDVSTPYEWSVSLSRQLPSATLLTYDGVSSGSYDDSPCARQAIDAYLADRPNLAEGHALPGGRPPARNRSRARPS